MTFARPVRMNGLRRLHAHMRQSGDQRASFQIKHNHVEFDCLFLVDIEPFEFVLAAVGHPDVAMVLSIDVVEYTTAPYFGDAYKALARLFNTGQESFKPFQPFSFLVEVDRKIPSSYRKPTPADVVKTYRHHVEEGDKPYFVGWLDNDKQGHRVRASNLEKTRRCFGQAVHDVCARTNQSSRWTNDPHCNRPYFDP